MLPHKEAGAASKRELPNTIPIRIAAANYKFFLFTAMFV
jgi:hypothetical protein